MTDSNFEEEISRGKPFFVMFYAPCEYSENRKEARRLDFEFMNRFYIVFFSFHNPGCESCKSAKSKISELVSELKARGSKVAVGASDSTHNAVAESIYKIKTHPTFKFFNNGKYQSDYDGKISVKHFLDYILGITTNDLHSEL